MGIFKPQELTCIYSAAKEKEKEQLSPSVNKHPGRETRDGSRDSVPSDPENHSLSGHLTTPDGILVINDSHFSYVMGLKHKPIASSGCSNFGGRNIWLEAAQDRLNYRRLHKELAFSFPSFLPSFLPSFFPSFTFLPSSLSFPSFLPPFLPSFK